MVAELAKRTCPHAPARQIEIGQAANWPQALKGTLPRSFSVNLMITLTRLTHFRADDFNRQPLICVTLNLNACSSQ